MLKIGDLSKITKVSVKTIRYYEEEKLLSPVEIDKWTGYRYYDETSINRLAEIVELKNLGFSLKEIRSINKNSFNNKAKELEKEIAKLKQNISKLLTVKMEGEKLIMKTFINDEKVIGKWKKLGVVKAKNTNENFDKNLSNIFDFNNLYFLPNGERYWVFSWTKGTLFLKDREFPYEIINGKLYVGIVDKYNNTIDCYAVYEQVDNKIYTINEVRIKDNTDLPFVVDKKAVGFWEAVDFCENFNSFNPNKQTETDLYIKGYNLLPNGIANLTIKNDKIAKINWTKNYIIDKDLSTVSKYEIKKINNETYMSVEWKSGDYMFGGKVNGFYIFKKLK